MALKGEYCHREEIQIHSKLGQGFELGCTFQCISLEAFVCTNIETDVAKLLSLFLGRTLWLGVVE